VFTEIKLQKKRVYVDFCCLGNQKQQILVPFGSLVKLSGTSQVVIIPNLNNNTTNAPLQPKKINAPIPIAPKPLKLTGVNIRPKLTITTTTSSLVTSIQTTTTCNLMTQSGLRMSVASAGMLNYKKSTVL